MTASSFPNLVERIIAMAANTFTFHGSNPAHSIHVGGYSVHFGAGGAAVKVPLSGILWQSIASLIMVTVISEATRWCFPTGRW